MINQAKTIKMNHSKTQILGLKSKQYFDLNINKSKSIDLNQLVTKHTLSLRYPTNCP